MASGRSELGRDRKQGWDSRQGSIRPVESIWIGALYGAGNESKKRLMVDASLFRPASISAGSVAGWLARCRNTVTRPTRMLAARRRDHKSQVSVPVR